MKKIHRRHFLTQTALGLGSAMLWSSWPGKLLAEGLPNFTDIPLGFQTFPIRDRLGKDFPGALKMMAGFGYKLTELCSPVGYADIGFGFLSKLKTKEIRMIIKDSGLDCPSCHFGKTELEPANLGKTLEFAHAMGFSQIVCSSFDLPESAGLKDYLENAELLNKAAEQIKKTGMETGFHNHEREFARLDGQLIYDALISHFEPGLVKMQFQTEVINLGFKASDYFNKYPGRFISSHLSDWTADKKEAPLGQGVIDWKEYFAAAKTGGVKNFFVEMNFDKFEQSSRYIQSL